MIGNLEKINLRMEKPKGGVFIGRLVSMVQSIGLGDSTPLISVTYPLVLVIHSFVN